MSKYVTKYEGEERASFEAEAIEFEGEESLDTEREGPNFRLENPSLRSADRVIRAPAPPFAHISHRDTPRQPHPINLCYT